MLRFFSKLKRFFHWFRNPTIASSDLNDQRFQKEAKQWLNRLKPEEQEVGGQILKCIAHAINHHPDRIDLSKFLVSQFPKKLIVQWLPYLQEANFSNHRIQSVGFINQLTYLQNLKMNSCHINKMSHITLPYLRHLELSDNQLSQFKFCYFKKVSFLKMNNNKIKSLESFNGPFPNLIELNLDNNQIKQDVGINLLIKHGIQFINLNANPLNKQTQKRLLFYNNRGLGKINFYYPGACDYYSSKNSGELKHAISASQDSKSSVDNIQKTESTCSRPQEDLWQYPVTL